MKTLKQRFEENFLLGCIKLKGEYNIYLMPIAWWILNYRMYDPTFDPSKWEVVFRDNILNVTDKEIMRFVNSIEEDKIGPDQLKPYISDVSNEKIQLYFFVDFDAKIFVNGFSEIEVELYLPDGNWVGKFEDPIRYLPRELKGVFSN